MTSLSTRIAVVISTVLFFMMVVSGISIDRQLSKAIVKAEVDNARVHAQSLQASLRTLMLNGQGTLARAWLNAMKQSEGVIEITILRRNGSEAFTDLDTVRSVNSFLKERRFEEQIDEVAEALLSPEPLVGRDYFVREEYPPAIRLDTTHPAFAQALRGESAVDYSMPDQLSIFMPIESGSECLACHGYDLSSLRGVLKLSVSTTGADLYIEKMRTNLWIIAGILVTVIATVLFAALRFSVLGPIARLRDAISKVGTGDRSARLPEGRRDELGTVAQVFNLMQEHLQESESRMRAVLENVVDAIVTIDEHGRIESANSAAERLFGYSKEELLGANIRMLMPDEYREQHEAKIERYLRTGRAKVLRVGRIVEGLRKDGTVFPVDITVSEMRIGGQRYFVGIIRDITERMEHMAALEHQALHDALTDLPNRTLLSDRLQQAVLGARRERTTLALMIADLDHFKEINDTLGHQNGDIILQQCANRMRMLLRGSDTVARLGGDEFAVLLPRTDEEQALNIARKLGQVLEQPFEIDEQSFVLGVSIGIAMFPQHGSEPSVLMRHADIAMYAAKKERRGYAFYDSEQNSHSVEYLALMSDLRNAISENQLVVHYQPVVDLQQGRVSGVEALARWNHTGRGLMMPDDFIPIAERTGQIKALTRWMLEKVAEHCRQWAELGLELRVAVNLSVHSLHDLKFPDYMSRLLDAEKGYQTRLRLEITESAIMSGPAYALEALNKLSARGIKISIDDFGTGYSSLSYLKKLPVDEIKIDKSFVLGMVEDNNDAVIVRSTIDLAHNIGMKVVAEGVEDEETLLMLKALHCDSVQGFFIGKPMTVDELLIWLEHNPWARQESIN